MRPLRCDVLAVPIIDRNDTNINIIVPINMKGAKVRRKDWEEGDGGGSQDDKRVRKHQYFQTKRSIQGGSDDSC